MSEDDFTKNLAPEDDPTTGLSTDELLRLILKRLSALEAKQYDSRPIWQAVEARMERIEQQLETVNNKLDVLGRHSLSTEADVVALGKRLEKIEDKRV